MNAPWPSGGILIRGGRVVDGAGVDGVADLYIADGVVVGALPCGAGQPGLPHVRSLDASGCLVLPGFIDVHSHVDEPEQMWLQLFDGVTTSLDLEAGGLGVQQREDAPIHRGWAASWALARMSVLQRRQVRGGLAAFAAGVEDERWRGTPTTRERTAILDLLGHEIEAGAPAIGMLLGYAPETPRDEVESVALLAREAGLPLVVHARDMTTNGADGALDELLALAETGTTVHVCHLNSTFRSRVGEGLRRITEAQTSGVPISTEVYPYGCASTVIGAAFLAPEALADLGITVRDVSLADGTRIPTTEALAAIRASNPGALALFRWLDERGASDRRRMCEPLETPGVLVASDGVPAVPRPGRAPFAHPRSAGSFARAFSTMVGSGRWEPADVVERFSAGPARLAGLADRGSLRPGSRADVVVLKPDAFRDRADYAALLPSEGIRHALVGGVLRIDEGARVNSDPLPGPPVATDKPTGRP